MPKKTKRQKILAQQHKEHMSEVAKQQFKLTFAESKPTEEMHSSTPSHVVKPTKRQAIFTGSIDIFKTELTKSLIITAALILFEIGIYVGQLRGLNVSTILPF